MRCSEGRCLPATHDYTTHAARVSARVERSAGTRSDDGGRPLSRILVGGIQLLLILLLLLLHLLQLLH